MRSRKALLNVGSATVSQLVVMVCGLIIPRLIIGTFGSEVHGIVASITRFLAYISFLELGITVVTRTSLYKPLAKGDMVAVGSTVYTTQRYFRKVAFVFVFYALLLALVFPLLGVYSLSYVELFWLVLVMSVGHFFHYYLGLTRRILLIADQRSYVTFYLDTAAHVVHTVLILLAVMMGAGIHLVKFLPFAIAAVVSIILYAYVNRYYQLDPKNKDLTADIQNKWAGSWIQTSRFFIEITPVTVLTLLTDFKEVSVYIVHNLVIVSIRTMVSIVTQGFESALGSMIAKKEWVLLDKSFRLYELIIHLLTAVLLTSTSFLIAPFIRLYTEGVADINYMRPLFAQLLIVSVWLYCIRLPYRSIIVASGAFKELSTGIKIELGVNIGVSVVAVYFLGIVGVPVGSIAAMGFQLLNFVSYLSKNILNRSVRVFVRRCLVSLLGIVTSLTLLYLSPMFEVHTYLDWIKLGMVTAMLSGTVIVVANGLFYYQEMKDLYLRVKRVLIK